MIYRLNTGRSSRKYRLSYWALAWLIVFVADVVVLVALISEKLMGKVIGG